MKKDFWVKCKCCGTQYINWVGSTPCCGSIAYIVKDGEKTNNITLFAAINETKIKPVIINLKERK